MAMEAVGFSQDPLGYYTGRELYTFLDGSGSGGGSCWSFDLEDTVAGFGLYDQPPLMSDYPPPLWNDESNALDVPASLHITEAAPAAEVTAEDRPKRRRVKKCRKNKEDIETQRMTHIAVERNRRKQMNEYLAVLRSLMPESYVQRSDQASIIGGAINFVKELEQQLHLLDATKHTHHHHLPPRTDVTATSSSSSTSASPPPPLPFSEFFTFPQYSTTTCSDSTAMATNTHHSSSLLVAAEAAAQTQSSSVADIEVTMVESHANMKIRSRKRPKQLLRVVSGLQNLRLTVLHLNVSTVDHIVLFSLSLKVEDDCKLSSVDEIASAVYEILLKIQEDQVV